MKRHDQGVQYARRFIAERLGSRDRSTPGTASATCARAWRRPCSHRSSPTPSLATRRQRSSPTASRTCSPPTAPTDRRRRLPAPGRGVRSDHPQRWPSGSRRAGRAGGRSSHRGGRGRGCDRVRGEAVNHPADRGTGGLAERLGIFARTFPRETPTRLPRRSPKPATRLPTGILPRSDARPLLATLTRHRSPPCGARSTASVWASPAFR
jgi:hypothetical protein